MAISNPRLKTPKISETWSESLHRRPRVPCLSNSTPLRSSMSTSESPEARSAPPACSMPAGFGSNNTGVSLRCISSKWAVASASLYYEYSTVVVGNGSVLLEPFSSSLKKNNSASAAITATASSPNGSPAVSSLFDACCAVTTNLTMSLCKPNMVDTSEVTSSRFTPRSWFCRLQEQIISHPLRQGER
ncbi:hypothetical protein ACFX16_029795 [Malus domestica]